jgi:hypothetical protein
MKKVILLLPLILFTLCTNPFEPEEKKPELTSEINSYWVYNDHVCVKYTICNNGSATAEVYEWDIYVETDKGNYLKSEEGERYQSDIYMDGVRECTKVKIRNLKCTKY